MLTGNWMRERIDARRYKLGKPKVLYASGGLNLDELLLPTHIRENLELARLDAGAFGRRGSSQGWEEVLYAPTADGAQVLNTATETILVPDFTLPANYMQQGRILKYTVMGDVSTVVTTPGTIAWALRWGGVAGTSLATSLAWTPKVTVTTTWSFIVEWWLIARAAPGAAASSFTMGRQTMNAVDATSAATIANYLQSAVAPQSAPAAVNIATNAANALTPTVKFSVATATTQETAHIAILEALN